MKASIASLQVGQEVAISPRHGGMQFGYTVKRITPSFQVVVVRTSDNYERRFDKDGYEIGKTYSSNASSWMRDQLITDVVGPRQVVEHKARAQRASAAIEAVRVERSLHTYSVETMQDQIKQLEALLAVAKAAVEAL